MKNLCDMCKKDPWSCSMDPPGITASCGAYESMGITLLDLKNESMRLQILMRAEQRNNRGRISDETLYDYQVVVNQLKYVEKT